MPTLARSKAGAPSPSDIAGTASTALPPPELLLRSGGGIEPVVTSPVHRPSREILGEDVQALLTGDPASPATVRWTTDRFARQVAAVRRHLDPIPDTDRLADSFGREAFHGARIGRSPAIATSPVRVAYAIRWIELIAGIGLPDWPAWLEPWPRPR